MPKIVKEADNFSSFIWNDLPYEALVFVHEQFFSNEMSLEDYVNTYFQNKVPNFKHEADRLFEEGKQKCIKMGTFPQTLNNVWTRKVITPVEHSFETKKSSTFQSPGTKDKNSVERKHYSQKIQQAENELDDFSRLNKNFTENNQQFLQEVSSLLNQSEELMSQMKGFDKKEIYKEQGIFSELHQTLSTHISQQEETFETIGRKTKNKKEEQLEKLYKKRNKLEW